MKIPSCVLHVPGHGFAAAILLVALTVSAQTQEPKAKSLLPVFGSEGKEFNTKGQNGNSVKGWLPNSWTDNSEWASVSATYTKLADPPEKAGAVRIKVEKIEDGQLQLTTYQGTQNFKKGAKYVVSGWVRSPAQVAITAGIRQKGEPYEFYHEEQLSTGPEWKRFAFDFSPAMDLEAFTMFIVRETGTVDIAGVAVVEKQ